MDNVYFYLTDQKCNTHIADKAVVFGLLTFERKKERKSSNLSENIMFKQNKMI